MMDDYSSIFSAVHLLGKYTKGLAKTPFEMPPSHRNAVEQPRDWLEPPSRPARTFPWRCKAVCIIRLSSLSNKAWDRSDACAELLVSRRASQRRICARDRADDRGPLAGPDAGNVFVDAEAGIAMGHRRLAILDLSERGAQPMRSACGRYVLTFNGEIYNHLSLRVALQTVADVPLGGFCPGSGLVDHRCADAGPIGSIGWTFTVGFDEAGFDELPHALAVAQHLGTQHHELRVTALDARSVIPALPELGVVPGMLKREQRRCSP